MSTLFRHLLKRKGNTKSSQGPCFDYSLSPVSVSLSKIIKAESTNYFWYELPPSFRTMVFRRQKNRNHYSICGWIAGSKSSRKHLFHQHWLNTAASYVDRKAYGREWCANKLIARLDGRPAFIFETAMQVRKHSVKNGRNLTGAVPRQEEKGRQEPLCCRRLLRLCGDYLMKESHRAGKPLLESRCTEKLINKHLEYLQMTPP